MRPISALLLAPFALSACIESPLTGMMDGTPRMPEAGPSAETRVADVRVTAARATFLMSDGARCVAFRPEGAESGWSGVTSECGYSLPFDVVFAIGGDPGRFTLEDGFGVVGPAGEPGARAEVYVTDVDGIRKLFVRPMPEALFEVPEAAPAAETSDDFVAPADGTFTSGVLEIEG